MDKKNSVLIVDDEKANIITLTHILSPEYTIYASKNGHDAIELANKHLPDVILLDIIMPEMDGYEVLSLLKSKKETREIPVIFITGLAAAEDEEKGLGLGAADYIPKPLKPAIVKLRVHNQIQNSKTEKLENALLMVQAANRAKSEFLARMSHEMRTPMNAIMGMLQIAKISGEQNKVKECFDEIYTASRQLLALIDDVLDVSGMEYGTFKLVNSCFNVNAMFNDALYTARCNAAVKQQELVSHIDQSMPVSLVGDEKRLKQVIENLLANAVKFTPEYGKISFSAFLCDQDNVQNCDFVTLQIEVVDNGIGIPEEQQGEIFKIFEQVDGSFTRKHGGIGLGLPLSGRIAEMMGGKISVESELGKGSKFTFTCKLKREAAPQ